ncbi:Sulfite oxidase, partial [Rasamsonia emersonii CBS 393.64]
TRFQMSYWRWRLVAIHTELLPCISTDRVATQMNDEPLTVNHGFPVRAVIPGVAGARWVKWLDRITVQKEESTNYYQRHDYKILPPDVTNSDEAEKHWDRVPAMEEMPVNSVVAVPDDNETVQLPPSGIVEVRGYAVPQGYHGPVTRVEVSTDSGKSWIDAELDGSASLQNRKWCWVLWTASVRMTRGAGKEILSRATDAGGNTQQEHSQWNLRGVGYNGYGASRNLTIV